MKYNNKKMIALVASLIGTSISFGGLLDLVPTTFDLRVNIPTAVEAEVGYYKDRVETGIVTHQRDTFAKVEGQFGSLNGFDLVAGAEYVESSKDLFATFVRATKDNFYVGGSFSNNIADGELNDDLDFEMNVGYSYDIPFIDSKATVQLAAVQGGAYDAVFVLDRDIAFVKEWQFTARGELGTTFGYADDYNWVLGSIRATTNFLNGQFYGELAVLDNSDYTDGFTETIQIGFVRQF